MALISGGYHGALAQILIIGVICFCSTAMYSAIVSMSSGITDKEAASNAAAALYGSFTVCSLVSPVFVNVLGARLSMGIGTLGYAAYVWSLLLYRQGGSATTVVYAGALNGFCAGLLWTAQGQMLMAYPTKETKASYFGIFWAVYNSGAVVGGLITFITNYDSLGSEADSSTFRFFLAIMLCGTVLCLLLAKPSTVVRPDGQLVKISKAASCSDEILSIAALFKLNDMQELLPLFLYSNFFYTYHFRCAQSTQRNHPMPSS
jgi:MFS family permease